MSDNAGRLICSSTEEGEPRHVSGPRTFSRNRGPIGPSPLRSDAKVLTLPSLGDVPDKGAFLRDKRRAIVLKPKKGEFQERPVPIFGLNPTQGLDRFLFRVKLGDQISRDGVPQL